MCTQKFSCRRILRSNGAGVLLYLQGFYVDIFDNVIDGHATNCAHVQLSGSLLKIERLPSENALHKSGGSPIRPLDILQQRHIHTCTLHSYAALAMLVRIKLL